ncbi:ubiquinol-cytochrome c reductase iron-sulfur subunit [Spirulina major]|uniref:QcrA and Rieske domain-containing protein n=1 Tax=Spirulina major TaxID=270636 RepID=UPI0009331717|nr:Rieske (2Fe-2S) protein [Spirulina major]
MERRQFLSWISVGMLASSLPVVLAACSPAATDDTAASEEPEAAPDDTTAAEETTPDATTTEGTAAEVDADGFLALATVDQLAAGAVLDETSAAAPVLILRDPGTDAVVALNPTCTHKGCTVAFKSESGTLVCPCHDAEFNLDGSVAKGPAEDPLPVYESREEGDQILVKVS